MDRHSTFTRALIITSVATATCLAVAAVIGFVGGVFLPAGRASSTVTVDERKSLPAAGLEQLSVETASTDVRVIVTDGDTVQAWLHGTAAPSASLPRLELEQSGASAVFRVDRQRNFTFGFFWSRVTLDVSVPRAYAKRVSVRTVSGNLQVPDARWTEMVLVSTSGNIETGRVDAGRADVSSVSGNVRVGGLAGDTRLHTTSGEIAAAFFSVPSVVDAASTSGNVALTLPSEAAFSLDAHSTSGNITCGFPVTVSQQAEEGGRHALAGSVGSGPARIAVRTVSGDIRISPAR